jgi:hypothetical protein
MKKVEIESIMPAEVVVSERHESRTTAQVWKFPYLPELPPLLP